MEVKKLKFSPKTYHFFRRDLYGVYELIYSFIELGRDCYNLSICNKIQNYVFTDMLNKSSIMKYRFNKLNKGNPSPYTFVYDFNKESMLEIGMIGSTLTNPQYINRVHNSIPDLMCIFFEGMSHFNSLYNKDIFFISGSYALLSLIRGGFDKILKNHKPIDIDVYILGRDKKKHLVDLMKYVIAKYQFQIIFKVVSDGKYEVEIGDVLLYNIKNICFSLMKINDNPSDVFAFFDLDCKKIGFFPVKGEYKIVSCNAFRRSLITGVNFLGLSDGKAGWKHYNRTIKYSFYVGIMNTMNQEHPLSCKYHTKFRLSGIRKWSFAIDTQTGIPNDVNHPMYPYYINHKKKKSSFVILDCKHIGNIESIITEFINNGDDGVDILPYICFSVGIVNKNGRYVYDRV